MGTRVYAKADVSRIGFMETFFGKMGLKNLRFKPAYNPYTEVTLRRI
jgi:phenylalanyl-tRNA synthetase alpha subunit